MNFEQYITQAVANLTTRLNQIVENARKIHELPWQTILKPGSKLQVSNPDNVSEFITVQQIVDASLSFRQNQLISIGTITVLGNDLTIPANATWVINNIDYSNLADIVINVPYSAEGNTRTDIIVADQSNNMYRVNGPETAGVSPAPNVPLNTVLVTTINVTDSTIDDGPPVIGDDFLHKTGNESATGIKWFKTAFVVGLTKLGSFIDTGRHLAQFNAGDQQTPLIVSGGPSTIEYFRDTLVPRHAWATGLQNPSSATIDYELYNAFRIFFSDNAAYQKIFEFSQQGNIYTKGFLSESITALTPTISGQPAIIKHVASVNATQPVKLVIYFHGSGTAQLNPFTDANSKYVIDKLLSEGHIVATSQAHGNAWGNQASQDDYLALYNYIIAAYNISDVIFVGHSMGGITSLNMIAKNTIPAVTKWYGIYPATNLYEAYYTEGFASAIETAYSFSGGANYAAATADNDPNVYAGSVYTGKKYTMTASPGDLTIIKTTNADLINTKFTGSNIDSTIVTASGIHGDISHFIPKHIAWFIFDKISVVNTAIGMVPRLDYRNNLIASAILDDGTNINLTRNTRLTGSTPTFSLINSASSNKRWDARVSGNNFILTESGVGNPVTVNAGGLVTLTSNLVTIAAASANHAVIKSQHDLKADLASPALTGTPTAPTAAVGTNTTQLATTAFVQATRPYKVYTALLTQTGASAPTVSVLENTLGGTVVWTRTTTGNYLGTLTGAFTAAKTTILVGSPVSSTSRIDAIRPSVNSISVTTYNGSPAVQTDGLLLESTLEIRVYP